MSVQNGRPAFMPGYQDETQKQTRQKRSNEQAIKAKFDDWVKQQEAGREVNNLFPIKATPKLNRVRSFQDSWWWPCYRQNDPSQPQFIPDSRSGKTVRMRLPDGLKARKV